jgi:hypothetical protein
MAAPLKLVADSVAEPGGPDTERNVPGEVMHLAAAVVDRPSDERFSVDPGFHDALLLLGVVFLHTPIITQSNNIIQSF